MSAMLLLAILSSGTEGIASPVLVQAQPLGDTQEAAGPTTKPVESSSSYVSVFVPIVMGMLLLGLVAYSCSAGIARSSGTGNDDVPRNTRDVHFINRVSQDCIY